MIRPRHERDNHVRPLPPLERSWSLSPGAMLGATLMGVALVALLTFLNWGLTREIQSRLAGIENRLTQLSTKVEQVSARAAAPAPARGPDPSRVYTIKTDGAPFKGAKDAPVTVAEFSDFQ